MRNWDRSTFFLDFLYNRQIVALIDSSQLLSQTPRRLLTRHHAIGGLLVAVVTGGDWVMKARGAVAKRVAKGGGGQMHVGALGALTQGQSRRH